MKMVLFKSVCISIYLLILMQFQFFIASKAEAKPVIPAPEIYQISLSDTIPDWLARWELARVLSYMNKNDAAIVEYEKLIKEKTDLEEAKIELSNLYFITDNHSKAIDILESISSNNLSPAAIILLADLYAIQKKYPLAEELYLKYLAANEKDYNVRVKYADLLSWMEKYDESINEFDKLLEIFPDNIQLRRKLGIVLKWAGKYDRAAKELKQTLNN